MQSFNSQKIRSISKFTSVFVLLLTLVGCASTEKQSPVEQDLELAQTALLNGHADRALSIYKQKLEKQPQDPQLLFLAGSAANQSAKFSEALHYLEKGSELAPSAGFYREIGRAYLALGDLLKASDMLEKSVELQGKDDVALNSLGVTFSLQQKYPEARDVYRRALQVRPDSIEYRNNLALAWMLDGNPSKAIDILYPIYQRGEASKKVSLNLAVSYAIVGKVDAAKLIASDVLTNAELQNNANYYRLLADGHAAGSE